jgi:serine/threonine protein phosphatase PrpC
MVILSVWVRLPLPSDSNPDLPMSTTYDFIFSTHVGNVRKNNEDYFGEKKLSGGHVFVVCDGMGGHLGGEIASKKAVECILDYFTRSRGENAVQMIHEAIKFANSQIHGFASTYPEYSGMGTTCVVVYLDQSMKLYYGHVGDSRLYLRSKNKLNSLTKDHSYVQFLVDTGEIKEEEMESHPSKNQILRALGIDEVVKPEVCPEPIYPKPGDLFLICSDGLNGMIGKEEIHHLLGTTHDKKDLSTKANGLIQAALEAGGKDNVTVGLIGFGGSTDDANTLEPTTEKSKKSKSGLSRFQKPALITILVLAAILAAIKFFTNREKAHVEQQIEVESENSTKKEQGNQLDQNPNEGQEKETERIEESSSEENTPITPSVPPEGSQPDSIAAL